MKSRVKIGVIHGRFQGLHLGHLEYLLEGKKRCDFLWIGITNPDPGLTAYDSTNPERSKTSSNPFTYFERLEIIRNALCDEGIGRSKFEIVPFPINVPERIKFYVPITARFFVTVYDEWNERKIDILRGIGVTDIEIMWRRSPSDRITSGTEIRNLILMRDQAWEKLVPPATKRIIYEIGLENLIKRMS